MPGSVNTYSTAMTAEIVEMKSIVVIGNNSLLTNLLVVKAEPLLQIIKRVLTTLTETSAATGRVKCQATSIM